MTAAAVFVCSQAEAQTTDSQAAAKAADAAAKATAAAAKASDAASKASSSAAAQQPTAAKPAPAAQTAPAADSNTRKASDWDFIEIVIFPGVPTDADTSQVYGAKLSPTVSAGSGYVCGVEGAAAACATDNIKGVQLAPACCWSQAVTGFQASVVNYAKKMSGGLQLGGVNYANGAVVQIGAVNIIPDSKIPVLPLINIKF
jgi:hypothetical protein